MQSPMSPSASTSTSGKNTKPNAAESVTTSANSSHSRQQHHQALHSLASRRKGFPELHNSSTRHSSRLWKPTCGSTPSSRQRRSPLGQPKDDNKDCAGEGDT